MSFDAFWQQYPRKVAKADARKAWTRLKGEQQQAALEAIPQHLAYWRACDTDPQFIPYPATWLRGERYEDELVMPSMEKVVAWWTTDKGVMDKGREIGLSPRPGEEMSQFKQRVADAVRGSMRRVA